MVDRLDDILKYRAGYFAGLGLVREITVKHHLSAIDLLTLDRKRFEDFILTRLSI